MDTDNSMNSAMTIRGGNDAALGRIDQYELIRELGGGGFGTVYLAKDTVSGVDVAVKGLPPFVKNNREELENIRRNFVLVSRLHHPGIAAALVLHPAARVSYSDKATSEKLRVFEGDTLMVMEYAPGATLSQWRRQFPDNRVPTDQAIAITRQIAEALDYAHERKIIHRDIKPANVMIETPADGAVTARVLDFGLAAEIRSSMGRVSMEVHDTSGTRPYMAPEQWSGDRQGPATDQYALAVLFCELITGEVPFASVFECGDPGIMLSTVTTRPFVPSQELPKPVRKALAKALAKKPEERFANCGDFVAALEGKISRGGVGMRRTGSGRLLAAAALLAALAGGGYFAWTKYDAQVRAREAEAARIAAEKAAEMARVKQEVYELKGKASQASERNAKENWHNWPHFSLKAKELEGAFRAGESALAKDDFEVARVQFLKVRDNWYWLSSNKTARVEVLKIRNQAEGMHHEAEAAQAATLAVSEYATATNALSHASRSFDAGDFPVATDTFGLAIRSFANAVMSAQAEARRLAEAKKKADTEAAIVAFKAKHWDDGFRLAQTADQENVEIQHFLGTCYYCGLGTQTNGAEAVKWHIKAAKQGNVDSQVELGSSYYYGFNVKKDIKEAYKWYRMAAENGSIHAMYYVGLICRDQADFGAAAHWFRQSIEQDIKRGGKVGVDSVYPAWQLGELYENGRGVEKDEKEAVRLYRIAADGGKDIAQYRLGKMYEEGRGCEKSVKEAKKLYQMAAKRGLKEAKVVLKTLELEVSMSYEGALAIFDIDIDSTFPKDKTIKVSSGADLQEVIDDCPDGATLMLEAGRYKSTYDQINIREKSVRIVGASQASTEVYGYFCQFTKDSQNLTLMLENMTIRLANDNEEYNPHSSGGVDGGTLVVRSCRIENQGIAVRDKSRTIISESIVALGASSEIHVQSEAKAILVSCKIQNANAYALHVWKGATVYCENTTINGGKRYGISDMDACRIFLRDCNVENIGRGYEYATGLDFGKTTRTFLSNVKIRNCTYKGIYVNEGSVCDYWNVNISGCGGNEISGYKAKLTRHAKPIPFPQDFFK